MRGVDLGSLGVRKALGVIYQHIVENMDKDQRKEFDGVLFEGLEAAMIASDPAIKEMKELREMMMRGEGGETVDG